MLFTVDSAQFVSVILYLAGITHAASASKQLDPYKNYSKERYTRILRRRNIKFRFSCVGHAFKLSTAKIQPKWLEIQIF